LQSEEEKLHLTDKVAIGGSTMTSRKGFTLIELLVVIVIIGILVAIALPNFIKIKDKAKEAEVKQNLHAIQLALERYAVDGEDNTYPFQIMGGDWTDSYAVWQSWFDNQALNFNGVNPNRAPPNWIPAPQHRGDSLIMEAYLPSAPQNPFAKKGTASLLPQIPHRSWVGAINRIVGGRESNKMVEVFGPGFKYPSANVPPNGDQFVHHIFNNPPYNNADLTKEAQGPTPWRSPSGNRILVGNFSFFPRNSAVSGFAWNRIGGGAVVGYTLAGYGSVKTGGQDVYNRNGNYKGRFRTTDCQANCDFGQGLPGGDIPCLCSSGQPPSRNRNDGGSDTIIDGVVITLDSGVDKSSKATNADSTEGV
jgi:prepilin-type N-terminal cleavage/methylation domain-containing protein